MLIIKKSNGNSVGSVCYPNVAGEGTLLVADGLISRLARQVYSSLPPFALLAFVPVIGLVYVVFLPFICIALLLSLAARKAFGGLLLSVQREAAFSWKPSEAYLAGGKGRARRIICKKQEEKKE